MSFKPREPRITIARLNEWYACQRQSGQRYSDDALREIANNRKSMTLLEVMRLDIPATDQVWVACRALSDRDARLFACWCAESVLPDDCDPRSRAAVDTARRYAYGEATAVELGVAQDEAMSAAWDAAMSAAWHAAEAVAWSAAWRAARSAARSAAWRAARSAAREAAHGADVYVAFRAAQVDRIISHLTGEAPLI